MPRSTTKMDKVAWSGRVVSVQPRIRLMRSFDERHHSYLGYVLCIDGKCGDENGEFYVAIGKAVHQKHEFRTGMAVSGIAVPVPDPRLETAGFYKTSGIKVLKIPESEPLSGPPFHGVPPGLETYREPGGFPSGQSNIRVQVLDLYVGLPDAGGDDHRSLEPVQETVPL